MALDPHDTATTMIPGVPIVPPKPPRTSAEQRMRTSGFQLASKRPSCGNCSQCDVRLHHTGSYLESQTLYCLRNRFNVGKHSICNDYERQGRKP